MFFKNLKKLFIYNAHLHLQILVIIVWYSFEENIKFKKLFYSVITLTQLLLCRVRNRKDYSQIAGSKPLN